MQKFARKSLFFVLFFSLFFILINLLFLGIIAITDWDFRKRIEALKFNNPDFEMLVLGNSLAEYGIDTELLTLNGIKSYNLAMIGSSDQTSYIQLNEYLTKSSNKPQFVLFCISAFSPSFYNKGIQPVVEFSMKDHQYTLSDIPVSKFRWYGVEILKKVFSSNHRKTIISYGQIKSPKVVPDYTDYSESYLNIKNIEISYWIGEVARLCNENGVELIIIEMPAVKELQNLTEIGPYTLHFENGSNAELYNLNNQEFCKILDIEKDWCGMSHLSEYGATRFTNEFLELFRKHTNQSF